LTFRSAEIQCKIISDGQISNKISNTGIAVKVEWFIHKVFRIVAKCIICTYLSLIKGLIDAGIYDDSRVR